MSGPSKKPAVGEPAAAAVGAPRGWRRVLFWGLIVELAAVSIFLLVLLVGERSRATLIALYLPRHPLLLAVALGALLAPLARRRVRALLASHVALGLVVLFPVMGMTVATSRATSPKTLRLASYNVFFGKIGRPALIDEIAAMPADVIVLQAAFASLGEKLHERLPDRTVKQDGELVLVSKLPVRTVTVPPPLSDGAPAMFVAYVIDTPSGALRIYNVHAFSPRHALFDDSGTDDNIAHREAQIEATVRAARTDVPPFVIAGDTNLPALSAIGRRHFSGLTDAFGEVGAGFGYTFPAKRPWMRIDRVLGSDGVRFTDVRVAARGASDHRALYVDLELADTN